MDGATGQFCNNCKENVCEANFATHSACCQKNIKVCKVCDELILNNSVKEHEEQYHISVKCENCSASVEKWRMSKHQEVCPKLLVTCEFCEGEFLDNEAEQHIELCGFRTESCEFCAKYILLKDKKKHFKEICPKRLITCEFCEGEFFGNEAEQHIKFCGSRTELCELCASNILLKHKKKHFEFHQYEENFHRGNGAGEIHQNMRNEFISKSSEKVLKPDKIYDSPHKSNPTVKEDLEFGNTAEPSAPPLEILNQVPKPNKIDDFPHKSSPAVTDDFEFCNTGEASAPPLETLSQSSQSQTVCHLCKEFILWIEYARHLKRCIVENSFKKCPRCNENIPPFAWNDHTYKTCSMLNDSRTQVNKPETMSECRPQTSYAFHDRGLTSGRPQTSYAFHDRGLTSGRPQTSYAFHDRGMASGRPISSYAICAERKICVYCDKELHIGDSEALHLTVCEVYKQIDPDYSQAPPNTHHGSTSMELVPCIICIDKERDTVFQPCGHLIVCNNCAKDVESTCPMCRKHIEMKIKVYIN